MEDARNKAKKEMADEATRKMQARLSGPPAPPFVPECAGCGLKGLYTPTPGGGTIRIIFVSGEKWPDSRGEFVCENCFEARTGLSPRDLL